MGLRNTAADYGSLARSLHWLVAVGIFVLIYLGLAQDDLPAGDDRTQIRFIHGSIAVVIFTLMTLRIVWRFMNTTPAPPAGMPAWQRAVAAFVHWGLYATVFVQLLAGAMVVSTGGKPLPFFGLFSIPLPVAEDHDNHEWWEEVHKFAWKPLAAVLIVHILAALYNHFVAKNDVLRRMTVGVK